MVKHALCKSWIIQRLRSIIFFIWHGTCIIYWQRGQEQWNYQYLKYLLYSGLQQSSGCWWNTSFTGFTAAVSGVPRLTSTEKIEVFIHKFISINPIIDAGAYASAYFFYFLFSFLFGIQRFSVSRNTPDHGYRYNVHGFPARTTLIYCAVEQLRIRNKKIWQ